MTHLELKVILSELKDQLDILVNALDLEAYNQELQELEQVTFASGFWQDQKKAQTIIERQNNLKSKISNFHEITDLYETLQMTYDLAVIDETTDLSTTEADCLTLKRKMSELRVETLLSKPYDKFNAIIEFHPGAGGTESQDWAEMLYRMYTRYAESKRYKITILDYMVGEETGLKSATILVSGANAYGYLKAESGVHRLVRISPFDSSGRRHTSFASVTVIPELDDSINIEINDEDLKIDVYRSGGNGGQSVNTTDSAVRITHLPTKIVVTCQNERSQIQNRETAMRVLKGKLYQLELERQQEQLEKLANNKISNAFGSQIRSYVFHPYSMVKDHRTDEETGNVQRVMDGDLDPFIDAFLIKQNEESKGQ